jgi:hypothetical protein
MSDGQASQPPQAFLGRWRHVAPWDSDDYVSEYAITLDGTKVTVSGRDLNDGEMFEISEVAWDGVVLSFRSFMPSTRREGLNEFVMLPDGSVESRFTFTVVEKLVRHET